MANEGVDVVICDQAKHWVPIGAWVGKKNWKACTCLLQRSNGVNAPGRSINQLPCILPYITSCSMYKCIWLRNNNNNI